MSKTYVLMSVLVCIDAGRPNVGPKPSQSNGRARINPHIRQDRTQALICDDTSQCISSVIRYYVEVSYSIDNKICSDRWATHFRIKCLESNKIVFTVNLSVDATHVLNIQSIPPSNGNECACVCVRD